MTSPQFTRHVDASTREGTADLIKRSHIVPPSREEEERYEKDKEWLNNNRSNLLTQYDETWIAVYGGDVIESHRNLDKLVEALKAHNVKPTSAVIEYLTTREFSMLL